MKRRTALRKNQRGTIVLMVVVALMFAATALVVFIERASTDMMVEARSVDSGSLRNEAYSALETSIAVLAEWKEVAGDLHHPAEGWGDALNFAGYEPGEGRKVEVTFVDESGRIPLSQATDQTLINVFKAWGMKQDEAERLTDGLMGWMHKDHVPMSSMLTDVYESGDLPFHPPYRVLRSFNELATIAGAKDLLYDEKGRPNEYWQRFSSAFSLYDYKSPNINAAVPELLANQGNIDGGLSQQLNNYLSGSGTYASRGQGYFRDVGEISQVLGAAVPTDGLDTVVRALRITVTVTQGSSRYTLAALVAPPGGATIPVVKDSDKEDAVQDSEDPAKAGKTTTANSAVDSEKKLKYPFAVLEITENDSRKTERNP